MNRKLLLELWRQRSELPKHFRILVMPEGTSYMKQFNLRIKHITMGALGGSIFFLVVVAISAYMLGTYVAEQRIAKVMAESNQLKSQVSTLSQRLTAMKQSLFELSRMDNLFRQGLGLPSVNPETREAGVGGTVSPTVTGTSADELAEAVNELEREIQFQKSSFSEIQSGIEHQKAVVEHTPSIRPISGGYIGSGYGYRRDPFTGAVREHEGLDINAPTGTPIVATAPGVVKVSKYMSHYGNVVVIDHQHGYQTVYGHMSHMSVRNGDTVRRGEIIGYVGMTGRASGPHVHYEVRLRTRPVDPMDFLFDTFAAIK